MLEYFSHIFAMLLVAFGQVRIEVDSEQLRYWTRTMEKYSFLGATTGCLSKGGESDRVLSCLSFPSVKGKIHFFLLDASFPMFFWGREGLFRSLLFFPYLRSF